MIDKKQLARDYLAFQVQGRTDDALAMLADNVVASSPMTGVKTGRHDVEAEIRGLAPGGLLVVIGEYGGTDTISASQVAWAEPEDDGDAVKVVGMTKTFGPMTVALRFDAQGKIERVDTRLGK